MSIKKYVQETEHTFLLAGTSDFKPEQKNIIKELARIGKRTNLNYVYLSPVDDAKQFIQLNN